MVPKFANPHSLSQDVEVITRSEIQQAGFTSFVHDENGHTLKRGLDNMLRDTWADALAEASRSSRAKKRQKTAASRLNEDGQLAFRLLSSMKYPQHIFLDPKPSSSPVSGGPDCEDDQIQAETRRIRAESVALELAGLQEVTVSTWQVDSKPVAVENKVPLANIPLARPLPLLLATEEARPGKTVQRVKIGNPQTSKTPAASPHEHRPSACVVLPVVSVLDQGKVSGKKRRKAVKERPPPAYWRPSPDLRGKCVGYALGYPSSWAPDRLYVRDTMKRGVESALDV